MVVMDDKGGIFDERRKDSRRATKSKKGKEVATERREGNDRRKKDINA